jgi:integrase
MSVRRYGEGTVYAREEAGGAESWYGRWYTPQGKRVHRKLGPKARRGKADGLNETQAKRELRRRMEADESAPVARPDRITFDTAAERAINHMATRPKRPLGRRTVAGKRSAVRVHMSPRFGSEFVCELEPADVEAMIVGLTEDGKAPKTILNIYTDLSSIFDYAVSKGWRPDNPCAPVEAPSLDEADPEGINYLDADEIEALLRAVDLDDEYGSTDRALYAVAAKCGLRQGELLALRWRDIDWTAERLRVRASFDRKEDKAPKTKAGRRSLPLPRSVAVELERHSRATAYDGPDDRVFCNPATGGPLDHSKLSRRFRAALKAAALRPIRFHDLRHSYGTRLAAAGVDLVKIKTWMGHKDINTTMIYAHYAPAEDEASTVEAAFATSSSSAAVAAAESSSRSSSQVASNQEQLVAA